MICETIGCSLKLEIRELRIRVLRKRSSVMTLQRTIICIAGAFIAVGSAESQAGSGPPMCKLVIEVNALRAGGKTVVTSPGKTAKVTAKARIRKGTALSGTTIDTTLTIEVSDGDTVLDTEVAPDQITLGVGKGGKGATLLLATEHCDYGYLAFHASFRGVDGDGVICEGYREIRKACR
jgi:hypothetical protein